MDTKYCICKFPIRSRIALKEPGKPIHEYITICQECLKEVIDIPNL